MIRFVLATPSSVIAAASSSPFLSRSLFSSSPRMSCSEDQWDAISRQLELYKSNHLRSKITKEQFDEICIANGLEPSQSDLVLEKLNKSGMIKYFPQNPALSQWVYTRHGDNADRALSRGLGSLYQESEVRPSKFSFEHLQFHTRDG